MPGNITRLYNFASQTGLPISSGQVDAELNQLISAADDAIDRLDALEAEDTALGLRVTALEGYNPDTRLTALEAADVLLDGRVTTLEGYDLDTRVTALEGADAPDQHDIDSENAVSLLTLTGDVALGATMVNVQTYNISAGDSGHTLTLWATPDATMAYKTWTIFHRGGIGSDPITVVAGSASVVLDTLDVLRVMCVPLNATGDGSYGWVIVSHIDNSLY